MIQLLSVGILLLSIDIQTILIFFLIKNGLNFMLKISVAYTFFLLLTPMLECFKSEVSMWAKSASKCSTFEVDHYHM